MEPFHPGRSGLYRPVVPSRIPRSVPDGEFNEIFAALRSHRDRALVAFYVSTGARASELLSATRGGADPGRQLITVVRKGTRERQQLPASADAFVWLRLYQLEMEGKLLAGRGQPLWWTLRQPFRPLAYHAAHRMFERAGAAAGTDATLHSLRHTAACRMAEDPALPLTDVQLVLGHALLTTTQLYLTPRKEDVIRRIWPITVSRSARPGSGLSRSWRRVTGPEPGCSVREPDVVTAAGTTPPPQPAASVWLSGYQAARTRFPPRPAAAEWPATAQARDQAAERLAVLLPGSASGREALLDWLAGQDGGSWQQRWPASGADTAAAAWWQLARDWPRPPGQPVPAVAALVSALIAAICADIVRPSLAWLAAGRRDHPELARAMAAFRDPAGFAQLRAVLGNSDPAVSNPPAVTRCAGPQSSWPPGAASWPISGSAMSWSCWTPRPGCRARPGPIMPPATGCCARWGSSARQRPRGCASCAPRASAPRRR